MSRANSILILAAGGSATSAACSGTHASRQASAPHSIPILSIDLLYSRRELSNPSPLTVAGQLAACPACWRRMHQLRWSIVSRLRG